MQIPELLHEDLIERTVVKYQYGVQLTYTDGQVTWHIRSTRDLAERMAGRHRALMVTEPQWQVEKAEVVVRAITVVLGDWTVDEEGEDG